MKNAKKILSLFLSIMILSIFPTSAFASEPSAKIACNEYVTIQVSDDVELRLVVDIAESRSGSQVYANAHGSFFYTGTTTQISQYGMDVTFMVNGKESNVDSGGNVILYHDSAISDYTASYDNIISGEDTSECSVTGEFTLEKGWFKEYEAEITLTLDIDANGKKTMRVNGNYDEWDVVWG